MLDQSTLKLYAITDRRWLKGMTLSEAVEEAILGGATFVQLREKHLSEEDFRREALEMQTVCWKHHVPFVLDDNVALAKEIDADGVHVGQEDMPAYEVRKLLGPDKIVGVTAKTVEAALKAEKDGADYLGVGAIFETHSHEHPVHTSVETLEAIARAVSIPIIAIGGIKVDNMQILSGTDIAGIAVISAIFADPNPRAAAAALRAQIDTIVS
ncbi:MAG: thiamine phosphate synthase [Oribacterium sp.]|jgi:thiamine-phosphate pyrophosphorylase|nr:thiamine phosphate synthase [Oribacterium sp.]